MKKIICIICVALLLFSAGCNNKQNTENDEAYVSFTVIDGFSGLPVEDVRVVLPDSDTVAETDSEGRTGKLRVPVVKSNLKSLPNNKGYFSVLAFKEGYNDYCLFFASVEPNEDRKMKIYIFKLETPMSEGRPLVTVESPDTDWAKELCDEYSE